MESLGLNEIRSMFREFFVSKGHYPGKSASLIPKNDNSLLIINSGMAPLKPYFAGIETPPSKRMTTCQKCIRTGDIDNVGITARHGTFFEMMGNFSFGDYFKRESLHWGWEFITEWLKMPVDRVWATVYEKDDEAVEIWKEIGMPEERIVRLGKDDNFWEIGLGPCGPCSEIYFDRGPEYGCGKPDCKPGCECDRYIEFWNHVFTQFSREPDGTYSDLVHKNIDTGLGLERLACIMQGVDSIFDIDTIRHILNGVVDLCGIPYEAGNPKADISIRIITDHLRSMVFMIADGIHPSNEGRGYVLRRLIRRAARHGRLLGIERTFLSGLVDYVVQVSGDAYPEIVEKKDTIKKIIDVEEQRFERTLAQGTNMILEEIDSLKKAGKTELDGAKAFMLYDTYGFPIELTQEILGDYGFTVDMEGFRANMEKQRETSRDGMKDTEGEAWKESEAPKDLPDTVFTGYEGLTNDADVLSLYADGHAVSMISAGETGVVYVDRTPFYAESGGQVSDAGTITADGFTARVTGVSKADGLIAHNIEVETGSIKTGDRVTLNVDAAKRHATARNHTATHLLQAALREVLGSHVEQSGSHNDEHELRFDFSHFEPMTPDQIECVEQRVNEEILAFLPVRTDVMTLEEAKKSGAMALFSEKYGDQVRVVNCGTFSKELCGGTHVTNTGEIGCFRIVSESSVASGVRRITAVTGTGVLQREQEEAGVIRAAAEALKATPATLLKKTEQMAAELRDMKRELAEYRKNEMVRDVGALIQSARTIGGVHLITRRFENTDMADLRDLADRIREAEKSVIMVFASENDGKVVLMTAVTEDLTAKGYHAGKLIKELAKDVGGGGGGKADLAQAGGKDPAGIDACLKHAESLISQAS